jgi:hypothetical protein
MLRAMPTGRASHGPSSPLARLAVLAAILTAPLVGCGRAHAGVTIVTQRGTEQPSTVYIEGDKMRAENAKPSGARVFIIDAAAKKLVSIDDAEKSYGEITQADIDRMAGLMAATEERMKSKPPEQRAMLAQMMGDLRKSHDFKFEKLGSKKTVNGFSCEMYRVLEDSTPKEEVCLTPWSASTIQRSDFAGLIKFSQDVQQKALTRPQTHIPLDELENAPGFPVLRHPLEPGQPDEVTKSIKRGSIPAATFTMPADYTKKELRR